MEEMQKVKITDLPICETHAFFRGPQNVAMITEIETGKVHYVGSAVVPSDRGPMRIDFDFPDNTVSLRFAFDHFDEALKHTIDNMNKKIIMPGSGMDMSKFARGGGNGRFGNHG